MDLIWAFLLGALQGVTEWLPISSSGHLVLVQKLLFSYNSVLFDVMVHGGTLLAVLTTTWRDLISILRGLLISLVKLPRNGMQLLTRDDDAELAFYTVIGTLPIVVVGLAISDYVDQMFNSTAIVGYGLLVTGFLLLTTKRANGNKSVNLVSSLFVGLAQALAIVPGISRSGSTISVGMLSGMRKEEAVRFSFLLSIPAISGALILEATRSPMKDMITAANLVGFLSSFIVGVIAIKALLALVRRWKLHLFAYYCFILGILALLLG